jgi:hypothetical protein
MAHSKIIVYQRDGIFEISSRKKGWTSLINSIHMNFNNYNFHNFNAIMKTDEFI